MKKYLKIKNTILFILFFLIIKNVGLSQDTLRRNEINIIVKTDILYPLLGLKNNSYGISLSLEKTFYNRHALELTTIYSELKNETTHRIFPSKQVIINYNYFLRKQKKYEGFFIGTYLKYQNQDFTHKLSTTNGYDYIVTKSNDSFLVLVGVGGFQIFLKEKISIDFLIGLGYKRLIVRNINNGEEFDYWSSKVYPDSRFTLLV